MVLLLSGQSSLFTLSLVVMWSLLPIAIHDHHSFSLIGLILLDKYQFLWSKSILSILLSFNFFCIVQIIPAQSMKKEWCSKNDCLYDTSTFLTNSSWHRAGTLFWKSDPYASLSSIIYVRARHINQSTHSCIYCVKTGKVTNNKSPPRNIHRKISFFRLSFFILYPMLGFATIRISYHETSPDNEVQLQKKLSL